MNSRNELANAPFFFAVLLTWLIPVPALAVELLLGLDIGNKSVWVEDRNGNGNEIAKVESDFSYTPSAALRSAGIYFSEQSQWGYFYSLDFSIFDLHTQEIGDNSDFVDLGTRLKGYSFFAVPMLFYHFKRFNGEGWQHKFGVGAGFGYLSLSGNFQITDASHRQYGKIIPVNDSGYNLAVGVYYEAANPPHYIILQNYGPLLESGAYKFQQHNVVMSYRYAFNIDFP